MIDTPHPFFTTLQELTDYCIEPGINDLAQTRKKFIAVIDQQFNLNGDMLKNPSLHVMPGSDALILHVQPSGTTHTLYSPAEKQMLDINERFINVHETKDAVINGLINTIKMHDAAKSSQPDASGIKHIRLTP